MENLIIITNVVIIFIKKKTARILSLINTCHKKTYLLCKRGYFFVLYIVNQPYKCTDTSYWLYYIALKFNKCWSNKDCLFEARCFQRKQWPQNLISLSTCLNLARKIQKAVCFIFSYILNIIKIKNNIKQAFSINSTTVRRFTCEM